MRKSDHQLVQRVLDGELGRDEFDRFQQRLREEPELVDLYGGYAFLHHALDEEAEGGGLQNCGDIECGSRTHAPLWIAAAVAMLVTVVLALVRPWSHGGGDVAAVGFSADAVWTIEGPHQRIGQSHRLAPGATLHLETGRAEVILDPLFTAVVEAPAALRVEAGDHARLLSGRGFFSRRNSGRFTVTTPAFSAAADGTAFGVLAGLDRDDEIHVENGKVRVTSAATGETVDLGAGEAAQVPASGHLQRVPAGFEPFATRIGRFHTVLAAPFTPADWRVEHGGPSITARRISGSNYAVIAGLPTSVPSEEEPVLLATMEIGKPPANAFHTDGWAGLSLFQGNEEVVFFGDSFGTRVTWSLDVKQRIPVVFPAEDVVGPMCVTLRYDRRTGEVTLHEGANPLGPAFCQGKLPAGVSFDSIRLGASAGAELDVTGLEIRSGGGR